MKVSINNLTIEGHICDFDITINGVTKHVYIKQEGNVVTQSGETTSAEVFGMDDEDYLETIEKIFDGIMKSMWRFGEIADDEEDEEYLDIEEQGGEE